MNRPVSNRHTLAPTAGRSKCNRLICPAISTMIAVAVVFLLSGSPTKAELPIKINIPPPLSYHVDWRWVQGAVFVPTEDVNEAQQWDEYDPAINDRELHYASVYGINCVRVFLHFDIYLKKKEALLNYIEDFLTRADKYGIKTEFVFFDDCWNQPDPDILSPDYKYPAPIFGVHNSRWIQSPGENVLRNYAEYKERLKAYVQDIVSAHKDDKRIAFWETFNEPDNSAETKRLLIDSYDWIHETGTTIPITATGDNFSGDRYSDFKSWHEYGGNYHSSALITPDALCTECMNRLEQTVPGVVEHFRGKIGFIMWEFGIGRDNCRFAWDENSEHPRKSETPTPFHGIVYPDGHAWSVDDVKALLGPEGYSNAPLFDVVYFKDANFTQLAKKSVTPFIDFDLGTERGTGSPDASAGVPRENFSVRWTGTILPPAKGNYIFYADGDNCVKIFVNGKLLLNKKTPERRESSKKIKFTGGQAVEVKVEYIHAAGDPSLHISWSGPGFEKRILTPVNGAHAT